jgi:hypothetical protein
MISGLQRERADQELAVVELQNTRLLIGLSERGCVLYKADGATNCDISCSSIAAFAQLAKRRRAHVRCARMTQKLYVGAGDNVDEMNLRCCEGSEHERYA